MPRAPLISCAALALFAFCNTAVAQPVINLSLNVFYSNTGQPGLGGNWALMAKTNSPHGIASINAYLANIHVTGISYGNVSNTIGAQLNNGTPFVLPGNPVNLVYFQDTAVGPIVINVGRGSGTPSNLQVDPLNDPEWNSSAVIARGPSAPRGPVSL
jgi:hypothetical protein